MKKGMKKIVIGALACAMMMSMGTVSFAKTTNGKTPTKTETTTTTTKKAQKVSKVTCTASGTLNVSFKEKVAYTSELSAVITDKDGAQIPCTVKSKTKSLLKLSAKGLVKGQTYTLKIEGVKGVKTDAAVTVEKTFVAKGMKTECKASKIDVEKKSTKSTLTVKLNTSATYKDATVEVVDEAGTAYEAKIVKKAKGNIKVQVTGLKKGSTYTVTINGIKTTKEKNFSSITKKFVIK